MSRINDSEEKDFVGIGPNGPASYHQSYDEPPETSALRESGESDDTPYKQALHLSTDHTPSWQDVEAAGQRLGAYLTEDLKGNLRAQPLIKQPDQKFVTYYSQRGFNGQRVVVPKLEGYGWSIIHDKQLTIQALGACLEISDVVINWDGLKLVVPGFPHVDKEIFVSPKIDADQYEKERGRDLGLQVKPRPRVIPMRKVESYAYAGISIKEQLRILNHHISSNPKINQGWPTTVSQWKTARERNKTPGKTSSNPRELTPGIVVAGMVDLVAKHDEMDLNSLHDYKL